MKKITNKNSFFLIFATLFVVASVFLIPHFALADGVLENIPDKTVQELDTLSFTATSTAIDQSLEFSLYNPDSNDFPYGASVVNDDNGNGFFSWTPNIDQGPGTYAVTIVATSFANDIPEEVGSSTFHIIVTEPDTIPPNSEITTPVSNSNIEDYFITISGTTSDNVRVVSTTISVAPFFVGGPNQDSFCGRQYTDIVSLSNPSNTSLFEWSYDWTPEQNGPYCIKVHGTDSSGNTDEKISVVGNINFTKKIDPVVPEPTPAPTSSSSSGGRRHPTMTGEVLGATTQVVEPQTVDIVWSTNIPSTSQVVYGLTIGGPYTLSPNSTNFGYPFATGKDNAKVLSHSVSIPNILVGQSYSLRVVSGVSTPTFGPEYRFTLNADGSVKFEGVFGGELIIKDDSLTQKQETVYDFIKINEPKVQGIMKTVVPVNTSKSATTESSTTKETKETATTFFSKQGFSWKTFVQFLFSK